MRASAALLLTALGFLTVQPEQLHERALPVKPSAAPGAASAPSGKKADAASSGRSDAESLHEIRSGDVVLCNHTSFVDVLLLASRVSPRFLLAALDGSCAVGTAWQALVAACALPPLTLTGRDPGTARGACAAERELPPGLTAAACLDRCQRDGGGPLAVLFEGGARTNGKTVLRPGQAARDLALGGASPRVAGSASDSAADVSRRLVLHYLAFVYPESPRAAPASPTHPMGTGWAAMWRCMATPYLSARTVRLAPGREPQLCDFEQPAGDTGVETAAGAAFAGQTWAEGAQGLLALMAVGPRGRPVQWDAADLIECVEYANTGKKPLR